MAIFTSTFDPLDGVSKLVLLALSQSKTVHIPEKVIIVHTGRLGVLATMFVAMPLPEMKP